MASITDDPGGRRRIQFMNPANQRKTIRLGKIDRKSAESIARHVEELCSAKDNGHPIHSRTASWLADIGDKLRDKLVVVGLIERREPANTMTVKGLVDEYMNERTDLKPSTADNLNQAGRAMIAFLGAARVIASVTEADAENFYRKLLAEGLALNTARRRAGRAKQLFAYAVRKRIIAANPFNGVRVATGGNPERQEYVPAETILTAIAACPSPEWRLIVALSRFGGLRCPSEHLGLTWADINWERGRFVVHSPKTEHHEGKGQRVVPIFPELYPYLRDASEAAEPGQLHVIARNRGDGRMGNGMTTNWRSQFLRILGKAGLTPWPRLFHGLRASCQTDLANRFPAHVVCEWLGNSLAVAREHYLQVTEDHFRAGALKAAQSPAHFGHLVAQNAAQTAADTKRQDRTNPTETLDIKPSSSVLFDPVSICTTVQMTLPGPERHRRERRAIEPARSGAQLVSERQHEDAVHVFERTTQRH